MLLGLGSALLASVLGFLLSALTRDKSSILYAKILPMLPLAISSVVLAYGWSSLLGRPSLFAVAAIQAIASYPFIARSIQGAIGGADEKYAQAALTLGSGKLGAALRVRLPLALPALLSGFAFAFAVSAGDANALIMAPVPGAETLATYLYRLAGSYRYNEACAVAVILGFLTGSVFFLKDANDGAA
jgi:thiamine transport system permease protein